MYSKITLVGTIKNFISNSNKSGIIILSTTRPFPDNNKIFQRDLVEVYVWDAYFKTIKDYIYEGQLLLIEGRLESDVNFDKLQINKNYVFAENIQKLTHRTTK